ncbi:MAG: CARDB domain-containing protein, partial [Planctomycetota bacterium]
LESTFTSVEIGALKQVDSDVASDHHLGPQLTVPGVYTLHLTSSTGTPTYEFVLREVAVDPLPLADQDNVSAEITNAMSVDVYSFDAKEGDRISFLFQSLTTSLVSELVSPTGQVIRTVTSDLAFAHSVSDLEVLEAGTYTIRFYGDSGATPRYTFDFHRSILNPPVSIDWRESVADTIEVVREVNQYTFDAASGEAFFVNFTDLSNGVIETQLESPDGDVLFRRISGETDAHDSGRLVAPVDGTYTLRVGGIDSDLPEFNFIVDLSPQTRRMITAGEIVFDQIDAPGIVNSYNFAANAGDSLFIDFLTISDSIGPSIESNGLRAILSGPAGEIVSEHTFFAENPPPGISARDLPSDGEYELTLTGVGDDLSLYEFQVNDVTPGVPLPISFDQVVSDSIDIPGEIAAYAFASTAGTDLSLDVLFNESFLSLPSFEFSIHDPSGTLLLQGIDSTTSFTIEETGVHVLAVSPRSEFPSDLRGGFSFRLTEQSSMATHPADLVVSDVIATPIAVGDSVEMEVTWTVTNAGSSIAESWNGQPWVDRILLSHDDNRPDAPVRKAGDVLRQSPLSPGESYTQSATVPVPAGLEGAFWVFVTADATQQVFEGENATNNTERAQSITAIYLEPRSSSEGPAISVIPADGERFPADTELALAGTVGAGNPSVNAIFVLDVSRSTREVNGLDVNGDGRVDAQDDFNNDGSIGDILDAEINATLRLTEQLRNRTDNV